MRKRYVYQGYVFANEEQLKSAKKEANIIIYLQEKTDFSNINNLLRLYNGILEKNMMKTAVGIDFLKEIREKLIESGKFTDEELRQVPTAKEKKKIAFDKKKRKECTSPECFEHQNTILKTACFFLTLFVICLLVILLIGIRSMTMIRTEEQIVSKYALWAQELQKKEDTLREYAELLEQEGIFLPEWQVSDEMEENEFYVDDEESVYVDDMVYSDDTYEWMIKIDGTVDITGYYGLAEGKVTLPKKLEGKAVTGIGADVFSGCSELTGVSIPDSVTSIGEGAFSGCYELLSVTLPKKLTSIGAYAFSGCEALKKVTLPSKLVVLGSGAFADCSSLTKMEIPDSVTILESEVFSNCYSLTEIKIPKTVREIDDTAFMGCDELAIKAPSGSVAAIFAEENGYELK